MTENADYQARAELHRGGPCSTTREMAPRNARGVASGPRIVIRPLTNTLEIRVDRAPPLVCPIPEAPISWGASRVLRSPGCCPRSGSPGCARRCPRLRRGRLGSCRGLVADRSLGVCADRRTADRRMVPDVDPVRWASPCRPDRVPVPPAGPGPTCRCDGPPGRRRRLALSCGRPLGGGTDRRSLSPHAHRRAGGQPSGVRAARRRRSGVPGFPLGSPPSASGALRDGRRHPGVRGLGPRPRRQHPQLVRRLRHPRRRLGGPPVHDPARADPPVLLYAPDDDLAQSRHESRRGGDQSGRRRDSRRSGCVTHRPCRAKPIRSARPGLLSAAGWARRS